MTGQTGSEVLLVQSSPSLQGKWNSYWMAVALKKTHTSISMSNKIIDERQILSQSQEADVRPLFHKTLLCGPMASMSLTIVAKSLHTLVKNIISWPLFLFTFFCDRVIGAHTCLPQKHSRCLVLL